MAGKNYLEKAKLVEPKKTYSLSEAVQLAKQTARAKFPESVDIAVKLGIDLKKANESVRGTVSPPHGTGKSVRVAVIARGGKIQEAEGAGADVAGGEELIAKIQGGFMEFEILIATPDMMAQVGKLGKLLGGKGLMPSPKSGTVTQDVKQAVSEFKKGRMEFRMDKTGVVHVKIGNVKFEPNMLEENLRSVMEAILKAKPSSAKGDFIKNIVLSTTMGPAIRIDTKEFINAAA